MEAYLVHGQPINVALQGHLQVQIVNEPFTSFGTCFEFSYPLVISAIFSQHTAATLGLPDRVNDVTLALMLTAQDCMGNTMDATQLLRIHKRPERSLESFSNGAMALTWRFDRITIQGRGSFRFVIRVSTAGGEIQSIVQSDIINVVV
jgi:hypothetical protein